MTPELDIILIGIVLVLACVIPGTFLVLRRLSLMSDAISHSALLGIVIAFFIVESLDSVWLILGASMVGMVTVGLTEALITTKRVKEDAAIGLVFPVFFSIGVILINKYATTLHFDSDCILFGEIAFAPFERMMINSQDLGPKALWVMGSILIFNVVFLIAFYKELKLATFDTGLAKLMGFRPRLLHYMIMFVTAITAVAAFESVGSILVVALMITPAATALLLSGRLFSMILIGMGVGVIAVFFGYGLATHYDTSIAGSIVTMSGVLFLLVFLFAFPNGVMAKILRFKQQKLDFSASMLLVQLFDHEGQPKENFEITTMNMVDHMDWSHSFSERITRYCVRMNYVSRKGNSLYLTNLGRELARQALSG